MTLPRFDGSSALPVLSNWKIWLETRGRGLWKAASLCLRFLSGRKFFDLLPRPNADTWLFIASDATTIARPAAVTSADRMAHQVHNLPACKTPVTFGWHFSTVVALSEPVSSWTYLLDQQWISSLTNTVTVAEKQLQRVLPYLPTHVIVVLDRSCGAAAARWGGSKVIGVSTALHHLQPAKEAVHGIRWCQIATQ